MTEILTAIGIASASALVLALISGFFSAAETGLTAASRARMHQLERDGDKGAELVNKLLGRRERTIGALLLGNNLLNTLAAAVTTSLLTKPLGEFGVAVATGVTTVIVLIFAEVLPKTYAISFADKTALRVAPIAQACVFVLSPLVETVQWIVRQTLRLFGVKAVSELNPEAAAEEIRGAVELAAEEGNVHRKDRDMLRGALDIKDMTVVDVMIHRKNMKTIEADLPPREILAQALSSAHSRIPLWRTDPDNIVGILHAKDLLRAMAENDGGIDAVDPAAIARPPWFVPETRSLEDQLADFLRNRSHFALVVDEYGGLKGLLTLEDILEEIVGDIRDEHEVPVQGVRPQPDGSVHVDGWVPIRDVNRAMDWDLPDDEAVTVAGLVIHEAQAIPDPGQRFKFHEYGFLILRRNRNQLTALRIEPPPKVKDETG